MKMKLMNYKKTRVIFLCILSLSVFMGCKEDVKEELEEDRQQTKKETYLMESGEIGGHTYVDLGLSVKWATYNIGAKKITERGDLFAWGETDVKETYATRSMFDTITHKWLIETGLLYPDIYATKYNVDSTSIYFDNKSVLEKEDDAASVHWGDPWRMPTYEEFTELKKNTECEEIADYNGSSVRCLVLTSKINGNKIVFPLDTRLNYFELKNITLMSCWTSSISREFAEDTGAYVFMFYMSSFYMTDAIDSRYGRHAVRAVTE